MKVIGADPGLANFGIAALELRPKDLWPMETVTFTTKPIDRERVWDGTLRRARVLADHLKEFMRRHSEAVAICAEQFSPPRSSSSAAKLSMAWGVLVDEASHMSIPIFQVSPKEIKRGVTGKKSATKKEVMGAMVKRWPKFEWPMYRGKINKTQLEHQADAIGAVVTMLGDPQFQMALRMGYNVQAQASGRPSGYGS